MNTKRLWIGFIGVMLVSFAVLLFFGRQIYREKPPVPAEVATTDGTVLFTNSSYTKTGKVRF